ncbi:TldD/PmbA family protein [Spirilliplanes yamanashiensis]|uniref:Zn-dependent protease n=1 Tax=Spirilliplanes yamanashiensis TaxID=42233 RepID=A0A8J4DGX6_9ACTN|nr:metallopeptidase TldD-related protein [Spirilliplanes yamanashiensis]MDP9814062.1 putative Zn-dependent protease [Spirilliplanes yamanashiensis]GIJ00958.1 hypothetical protein Sya03_03100 [Spirilliplanes yamanashiensis]
MSAELDLATRVVAAVRQLPGAEAEVWVLHTAQALTRFANSAIHQNVADASTTVRLRLHLDGRTSTGSTTVTTPDGLRAMVDRTVAAARLTPRDPGWAGLTPPTALPAGPDGITLGCGYDTATAQASPAERAVRVRDFVRAAGGLETAGYCRTTYRSAAFANSAGHAVEGRAAEAAMDGIARLDGADGVARTAGGRIADVDGAALGERAAAKARAGGAPVELPPGRYEVVLEPAAVADVLQQLAYVGFNGKVYTERQSFAEPGAQQFDLSVTITEEPPGELGLPFDAEGTPRGPLTLVEDGVTRGLTHDRRTAAEAGHAPTGHATPGARSFGPIATHLRLAPGPGSPPVDAGPVVDPSAAPLLGRVERGLLVSDFWYTRVLDTKNMSITGLTRNGVWLVEDGEVTAAVGNLRFTQSYTQALGPGQVLGYGTGTSVQPERWAGSWYEAPAVHLRSWNVTGNASG